MKIKSWLQRDWDYKNISMPFSFFLACYLSCAKVVDRLQLTTDISNIPSNELTTNYT